MRKSHYFATRFLKQHSIFTLTKSRLNLLECIFLIEHEKIIRNRRKYHTFFVFLFHLKIYLDNRQISTHPQLKVSRQDIIIRPPFIETILFQIENNLSGFSQSVSCSSQRNIIRKILKILIRLIIEQTKEKKRLPIQNGLMKYLISRQILFYIFKDTSCRLFCVTLSQD